MTMRPAPDYIIDDSGMDMGHVSPEMSRTVTVITDDGCWVPWGWSLTRARREYVQGRRHREAFTKHWGRPIPPGYQIGHTCHMAACSNPDHLVICSPKENQAQSRERRKPGTHTPEEMYGSHQAWVRGEELPPMPRRKRQESGYQARTALWDLLREQG